MLRVSHIIRPLVCAAALSFGAIGPLVISPESGWAQSIQLQTQSSEIHADMPFQLSIVLTGFDEEPQPEVDPFEIENAQVIFHSASPRVSSMISIINGRRTERKDVTYVFNYQVTPQKEGVYRIPAIHAKQGSKEAQSQQMTFKANAVQTTVDMKLELQIPDRKFWVGETFEATLMWYLRRDPGNQQDFVIPILDMPDTFEVETPERSVRGQSITLRVGSHLIGFPYSRDNVMLGGLEYARFSIPIRLTPLKSGEITIPASQVVSELVVKGTAQRDFWGFDRASYELYKAVDHERTCSVQAIPESTRPATFTNAMGSDFDISVSADRTIVKAGDPIELTISISSPSSMEGLILPSLNAAGLNEQLFGIPTDDPVGENIAGANSRNIKQFRVPVRVKSDRVTEIPPIAFSFFNPKTSEFTTVRSQPIALSVTAVDKISAADVISAHQPMPSAAAKDPAASPKADAAALFDPTAGALELSLHSSKESLNPATHSLNTFPTRLGIYACPFLIWCILGIGRRIRRNRQATSEQRTSAIALKNALDQATMLNPREAASEINNALNAFLAVTDTPSKPFQSLREKLDDEAYRPDAHKLPEPLMDEFRETVKKHVNPAFSKLISSIFAILLAITCFALPSAANAQPADDASLLANAHETYHQAMMATERTERIDGLKRAFTMLKTLSDRHPDSADLYVDCGNAALGAADFGQAALAYKRALKLDPSSIQAKNNLAYIQSSIGDSTQNQGQIVSTAFFFNDAISRDMRLLIAAIFFALGMLLVIPWNTRARRIMCYLSVFPFILWIWMLASTFVENEKNEAVVLSEVFLKTADNSGSSNVSSSPLEPGFVVEINQTANAWFYVTTSNGSRGWIPSLSAERIENNP